MEGLAEPTEVLIVKYFRDDFEHSLLVDCHLFSFFDEGTT